MAVEYSGGVKTASTRVGNVFDNLPLHDVSR